jgi:hypothetical protein
LEALGNHSESLGNISKYFGIPNISKSLGDFTWKSLGSDLQVFGTRLVMRLRISFNVNYNADFDSLRLFAAFSVLNFFPDELDDFKFTNDGMIR